MNTKAQIRTFESIAVLIIFFFLLITAASFYFKIQSSSIKKEIARADQLRALQTFQKTLFLPELDCSFISVQKDSCFDLIKIRKFQNLIQSNEKALMDYYLMFGYSEISVQQIYPNKQDKIIFYSNIPEQYTSKLSTHSTVLIYDPFVRTYNFGIVEVNAYAE